MNENAYASLRRRILASMIIVPAIPFLLIVVIGYSYFVASLQSSTISQMTRIVEDHQQMIESFLEERRSDLEFLAATVRMPDVIQAGEIDKIFYDLQKKSEAFSDIGVFDNEGLHLAYHGPYELAGKNYSGEDWFKEVLKNQYYISDVFLGFRKSPHFIIAVVKEEDDRLWVIRATIDTSLFSSVVEKIRIGQTGEAYLLNTRGEFQTNRRSGGSLMEQDPEMKEAPKPHKSVTTFVDKDGQGKTYLYASTWLHNKNWLLMARQERAEAFKDLYRLTYLGLLVAVLGGVVIIFMAFEVTRRITSRMQLSDTEKRELKSQLVVAGRLAEIGEMSAGFAHEINNPLQIIKSELMLAGTIIDDMREQGGITEGEDLGQVLDSLRQIKIQVDRCGGITQGLLKFARKKDSVIGSLDLKQFLPNIISLVEKKASVEGIRIEQDIQDCPPVHADASQLEQVVVNLLNNAIYAITQCQGHDGGRIGVGIHERDEKRVELTVSDTGCGISPENMEKIFTPFFTTKPVGQGTGLGLSICYGIITEMGGRMEVESEVGRGTEFKIQLKKA